MSLQTKILNLKLEAALALRHANGWQKLIDVYGEDKAQAFYLHLGLNHLLVKSYNYDGLTLSREPKPHEALQVKAIASAQESSKERLSGMMLAMRSGLVDDAVSRIEKLSPSKYHTLIVTVGKSDRALLRELVEETFNDGRLLIQLQRGTKADSDNDYDDELDDLTDITTARLANDVQARITGAASRYALLGQSGIALINSVTNDIRSGSVSYIDRAATGLANRTLNLGRSAEASKFDWEKVAYSALLDSNCCEFCLAADGQESTNPDDLEPVPNISCLGTDLCRCFWVYIET